jgi:simple sugar transport system ATP-binding protein
MTSAGAADAPLALAMRDVAKRYGGTQALADASLFVRPGTVHALLGENGAGKTTLMRIAFGLERPDRGTIHIAGRAARFGGAADAIQLGVGMVHQHFSLVPVMTVAENVALGGRGTLDLSRIRARLRSLSERTGFALDPDAIVGTLSVAAQQRVEIAKALMHEARLLVLDEPTAVLAPAESAELLRWLRAFADAGNAAVFITHKLREALSVADDVTVLRRGQTVLAAPREESTPQSLTAAMIGSDGESSESRRAPGLRASESDRVTRGEPVFRATRMTIADEAGVLRIRDASVAVWPGEIVGIAAVDGNGQRELLRALAGRLEPVAGTLSRPANVGFVPEDRHRDAVLLERSLAENVALRDAGARRGVLDWSVVIARTDLLLRAFDVRAEGARVPMRTLSGGNQQRVVLARELARELAANGDTAPAAVVAENPTRGLDVRATEAVHERLRAAGGAGAAVIVYSSDIDEVLLLADRVLVVYDGRVSEVPAERDTVGRAMVGVE